MKTDKLVEIKISKRNINHYTEKGYIDLIINEISNIKSCDVIETVKTKIYVICENCNIEKYIESQNYHNQIKKGGIYVCFNCSHIKIKKTNIKKYGTECPLQNNEIIEKSKRKLIENYGVDNISKLDSIRENRRNNFRAEDFKEKSKNTWLSKYGVDNPSKSEQIKSKKVITCIKNHGVENPSQSSEIFEKSQINGKKIKLHEKYNLYYRGSYEKDFLDFCFINNIVVSKALKLSTT